MIDSSILIRVVTGKGIYLAIHVYLFFVVFTVITITSI